MSACIWIIPLALIGLFVLIAFVRKNAFIKLIQKLKDDVKYKKFGRKKERKDHK